MIRGKRGQDDVYAEERRYSTSSIGSFLSCPNSAFWLLFFCALADMLPRNRGNKSGAQKWTIYGLFFSFAFYEVIKEFCKGQTR